MVPVRATLERCGARLLIAQRRSGLPHLEPLVCVWWKDRATVPSFSREWGDDYFSRTATPALRIPDFNMSSVSPAK